MSGLQLPVPPTPPPFALTAPAMFDWVEATYADVELSVLGDDSVHVDRGDGPVADSSPACCSPRASAREPASR